MELNNILNSVGWTIINSIWQGFFILTLLMIAMLLINTKYSKIRSMIAFASLIILFAASIRTYLDIDSKFTKNTIETTKSISSEKFSLALLHESPGQQIESSKNEATFINKFFDDAIRLSNQNIEYIVLAWLVGVLLMSIRLFGGFLYIQKLKTRNTFQVNEKWIKIFDDLLIKMQVNKSIELLESAIARAPMVIGYFKPVILMPFGALAQMPANQIELILAHEIAHIKNSDYLLNLIQSFLEVIYFFNPAVWMISKIIRTEREFVCDDIALSINENSTLLAKALLSIQSIENKKPIVALSALGDKNSLLGRIKRMKNEKNISVYPKKLAFSAILIGLLLTATFISCSSSIESHNQENSYTAEVSNFSSEPSPASIVEEPEEVDESNNITIIQKNRNIEYKNGERKFNFHKNDTHWKGVLKDGKVITLYRDGEKIPDDEISKHEESIISTLEELDSAFADVNIDMDNLKEDLKNLKNDLKDINIDFDHIEEIKHHLNSKEFKEDMEEMKKPLKDMKIEFNDEWKKELKESLKHVRDIDLSYLKSQEFKNVMEDLKLELAQLKDIEMDFDFNKESFKESMKELKANFKDIKIDIADMDIDLSDLKVEMIKLKGFLKDLETDLVSEGYLTDEDDDFDMHLSKSELILDGKKLPDHLKTRYLNMYEKHFGEELDDEFNIRR